VLDNDVNGMRFVQRFLILVTFTVSTVTLELPP
jgi:hypothetical protein